MSSSLAYLYFLNIYNYLIKKYCFLSFVIFLMMFSTSCNENFNTAHINLYNVKLVDMCITSSSAYYLSETGTLYSPGADPNASHYVLYQNPEKGIVANNVKEFGEMVFGGFYIDNNNSLYIWNQYEQPLFNYKKEKI